MEVVTGAMSTLLPKLGVLLKEEYKLQKGVRGGILFLKAELESMQTFLLENSEAPIDEPPNRQAKLWAKEVRELSYDLEDSIDKFMVRIDHMPNQLHGLRGFIDRSLNLLTDRKLNLLTKVKIRHEIASDIKVIRTRIREVKERHESYKIDNITRKPTCPSVDTLRLSAIYKKAKDLIGIEEKGDDLVKMLLDHDEASNKQLKTISIVGFGGLGKTTLAHVVYMKLKGKFDCGAFVTVSLSPNMDKVFKNMLYQLDWERYTKVNGESLDETQLIQELRDLLSNKRYIIVIDDIWKPSVWKTIGYALPDNENGSRVISTTRILDVAKRTGCVYKLQPLSQADSRKLFYLRIFCTEDVCLPNELVTVSENILQKCGGVPLAIITIASMLASKIVKENTYKHWSDVYRILGSGLQDNPDLEEMRRILSISYYDLPPHLKACMLYLSSYSEDDEISTKDLIHKWVGEGFILNEQGRSLYDVGEDYVDELINRSMIEPSVTNHDSKKAVSCRVHDMILDLIIQLSNEDGFLTTLNGERRMDLPKQIRRLSLQTSNHEDVKQLSTARLDHVRSLTVAGEAFNSLPAMLTFPVLRLLDLSGCEQVDNHYFKCICNLFHLRYLRLSDTSITEIPKEIKNLQYLQFLDVSETEVKELPSTFVQLGQLLYLLVSTLRSIPDGFGNLLKQLEALDGTVIVDSPTMLRNLAGLSKLRRMDLLFDEWDASYEEPFIQCLGSLGSLGYQNLTGCNGDIGSQFPHFSPLNYFQFKINMGSNTSISVVPRCMSSLCALTILHISLSTLGEEDLHVLGSTPYLSQLQLFVEKPLQGRDNKLVISTAYPFPCLTKFKIFKATGVVFSQGAMPKLQTLELVFGVMETFDKFGDFDFGLENLSSLVHVSVSMGCSETKDEKTKAAEDSIRKALDMNPNKPTLTCMMSHCRKMRFQFEGCQSTIRKILTEMGGVTEYNIELKQKVTVSGSVDPTKIINKLKKAGMHAQLLSYMWEQFNPNLTLPHIHITHPPIHITHPPPYSYHPPSPLFLSPIHLPYFGEDDDPNSWLVM